ncbi:SCO7613 C-terminal domain-containing membrane protein [Streptomyces zhihengii]|uniref:SCO7613 C-terminal domain-containing membrane protein n=1 Tax=Streptomyces zhihengii TaxID=1818004 RepID=UPI0036B5B9E1
MTYVPPPAEELAILDSELRRLDARRAQLLARRSWLLAALRGAGAVPASPPAPPAGAWTAGSPPAPPKPAGAPPAGAWPAPPERGAETSGPGVQNLLLVLGGLLLAVAAVAFTLVSWGQMGIGGRSAVLGAVTVAALAAPAALLRRGLRATAEAVGVVALVLTVLDAYALHRVAFPGADGVLYTAVAATLLSALWSAHGLLLPRLSTPLPAAVLTAQLALPLWALSDTPGTPDVAWALLATAALDVVAALRARPAVLRGIAGVAAAVTGGGALLTGLQRSVAAGSPAEAVLPGVLLLAGAALALWWAWRAPAVAVAAALVAGVSGVAAVGGAVRAAVPPGWGVLGYLLCGTALLLVLRTELPAGVRRGLAVAAGTVQAVSALSAVPLVLLSLVGPASWPAGVWEGAPSGAREALPVEWPLSSLWATPVVLAVLAATAAVAAFRPGALPLPVAGAEAAGRLRRAAVCAAAGLAWAALLVVPAVADVPWTLTVAWQLATALGLLAWAAHRPAPASAVPVVALVYGLTASVSVALLSLATRPATFTVLGVLTAALAAVALRAGGTVRPAVAACAATLAATGLAGAAAAASGLPAHQAALFLLAVPAAAAAVGARLGRHPVALPVEAVSGLAALIALVLAAGRPGPLSLVLGLCGVIAAATALRAERRPAAGHLAAVLLVLAAWTRLLAWDVTSPEAYTLPVSVPALAVGALRRRRDPGTSSWTAYGPGLAVTLVPSLLWTFGDTHWLRPLLLGLAALAVTLAGAKGRLQAPLVLGGTVLALVALHELAPYVAQVVGALPRWIPPAAAGVLLLATGATYEQRLRDARRLREGLGRMR